MRRSEEGVAPPPHSNFVHLGRSSHFRVPDCFSVRGVCVVRNVFVRFGPESQKGFEPKQPLRK